MDVKAVCFLCVLACAVLTSCAQSSEALDVAADMARTLERIIESLKEASADGDSEEDGEEVYSRRRRVIGGLHGKGGFRYKGRPRRPVYRPLVRPDGRLAPRPAFSRY